MTAKEGCGADSPPRFPYRSGEAHFRRFVRPHPPAPCRLLQRSVCNCFHSKIGNAKSQTGAGGNRQACPPWNCDTGKRLKTEIKSTVQTFTNHAAGDTMRATAYRGYPWSEPDTSCGTTGAHRVGTEDAGGHAERWRTCLYCAGKNTVIPMRRLSGSALSRALTRDRKRLCGIWRTGRSYEPLRESAGMCLPGN